MVWQPGWPSRVSPGEPIRLLWVFIKPLGNLGEFFPLQGDRVVAGPAAHNESLHNAHELVTVRTVRFVGIFPLAFFLNAIDLYVRNSSSF